MSQLIQVFEHQPLKVGQQGFTAVMLTALQQHYGTQGKPYYSLIYNGVKFNQFVGVLQVGQLTIEVLPKIDRSYADFDDNADPHYWQQRLIAMLLAVNSLDSKISGTANLTLKANAILDAYFSLFINEVESLLHKGLIKQYHKQQGNLTALKGRLSFPQHIRQNSVHQERFFVEHTVYDPHNIYNQILYKTIKLISQFNRSQILDSRINRLLLSFPEMADIYVDHGTFDRIIFDRKNQHYQAALAIAKLLLLNYHPDITRGKSAVLALMFDMNLLWERFVLTSLRRYNTDRHIKIKQQATKSFWRSTDYHATMRADIVIHNEQSGHYFVLDTKWKHPMSAKPSIDDLRQLYTYHHYYQAEKVALIYPSSIQQNNYCGDYVKINDKESLKSCSLLFLHLPEGGDRNIDEWQQNISNYILDWLNA